MPMVKTYKKAWLKELRSGNHKQTSARLTRKNKSGKRAYCCLGILCRVLDKKFNVCKFDLKNSFVSYKSGGSNGFLPAELLSKTKIPGNEMGYLSFMNDCQNKSFKEIANYIDTNL